jgi:PAS domain-containing protein
MEELVFQTTTQANGTAKNFNPGWKRFHPRVAIPVPMLALNEEGTILHVTDAARRLMEYGKGDVIDPCFFAHIHGKNLYQVMRDIADMVCYGKSKASWLFRVRTGKGRWRWFKATARAQQEETGRIIEVALNEV